MATGIFSNPTKNFDLNSHPEWFDGQLNELSPIDISPLITGYGFIKWISVPDWVEKKFPYFRQLSEKGMKNFEGNDDLDIETPGQTQGFSKTELASFGGIGAVNNTFSMTMNEFSGSPLSKALNFWAGSIRDPRTNLAVYPGYTAAEGNAHQGEYGGKYHTGTLLYARTRPDFNINAKATGIDLKKVIEYAAIYSYVAPKKIMLSHFNLDMGTNESQAALVYEFTGKRAFGDLAIDAAVYYLKQIDIYNYMNDSLSKYIDPATGQFKSTTGVAP